MYELDENMKPVNSMQFLGDEETVKKAIESVAAQVQGVPINMGIKGTVIGIQGVPISMGIKGTVIGINMGI